jgi:hypothetical protein
VAAIGALALADAAISLLLIEDGTFLGRPLPPFGAITHPRQRAWLEAVGEREGIGRFDPELGWSWRPSSESEDGLFRVNALGARGPREYPVEKPAERTRLACFGDSFVFGDEIREEWTFESILESRDARLEALNFGVSGYGTDQALLRYRRVGRLDADVVVIGLLLENIGRNVNRYRPLWNTRTGFCAAKPRFLLGEGGGLELLPQPFATKDALRAALREGTLIERIAEHEHWYRRPPVPTGRWSSLVRIGAGAIAALERSPERLWSDPAGEPFRVTLELLESFHREALADGARAALVVIFPLKQELYEFARTGERYWDGLAAELERRGVDYLDPIPSLAETHRACERDPALGTVYFGGHLSSVGNGVVAAALHAWLVERGLF